MATFLGTFMWGLLMPPCDGFFENGVLDVNMSVS